MDRYVSDFDCHVYYPRELELLFRLGGFEIERRFGSYDMRPPSPTSRQLIYDWTADDERMVGVDVSAG